jgi:alpha-N-arabinofuranosidase
MIIPQRLNSFILLFLFFGIVTVFSQNNVTIISLHNDKNAPVIDRNIYGHFAEHLGRCIYEGLYIGEENKIIPNTAGVRNDIIDALKVLNIPNLRWPGGCFADTYHWKDGVGPKENRPTIVNRWWGGQTEDNSFGTHDFLNLCETLGAQPYLSANVGSGTVQELIDWVQYTNHGDSSPMADWRRENGRKEPWKVTYWGIGNETWGCGGNMTAEYYANVYRNYATFMDGWSGDHKVFRIASGASGDDYHWTEVLMKNVPYQLMEAVALHHYAVIDWTDKGPSRDFDEEIYFRSMKAAFKMEEYLTKHIAIMDTHDPEGKVALFVDEWGGWYDTEEDLKNGVLFQQNTMRDAMIAATTLNTFNNHARRVKMANLAQIVNVLQAVILTDKEKMILTPTYHVMNMYKAHQDAQLLPVSFQNKAYSLGDENLPALSISASADKNGSVHISLANVDAKKENTVEIDLKELDIKNMTASILSASKLQDHNTFADPYKLQPADFKNFDVKKGVLRVTLPPFSVIVFEGKD